MTGITPGDLVVAGSVVSAVLVAYHAIKGQLGTLTQLLTTYRIDLNSHASKLAEQGADIRYMARKTASIEGKVFGRRIEDRMPSERAGTARHPEDLDDGDQHYKDTDRSS